MGLYRPDRVHTAPSTVRERLISAMVLTPFAVIAVWLGGWMTVALAVVCGGMAMLEWGRLGHAAGFTGDASVLQVAGLGVAGLATHLGGLGTGLAVTSLTALLVVLVSWSRRGTPWWALFGAYYIGLPVISFIWLRGSDDLGLSILLCVLLTVWITDTAAFFVGRMIGGRRLAPRLSPSKTWAGSIGGLAAAALFGVVFAGFVQAPKFAVAALSALLSIVAQIGDLLESAIKRRVGVKDSGMLIPGHGGALDRLDSLLLALPIVALVLALEGREVVPWAS